MFGVKKGLNIHFIGIGGIGMSGIADILLGQGYHVSGSDLNEGENVLRLRAKGAVIFKGHSEENINNTQIVVYSSAIDSENPEIQKAILLKIPIIKRAEMLAELMRLKYGIAIAGSHGKTTTTSFMSTIFNKLDQKPTCIVGGIVKDLGSQAIHGDGKFLIAEADESDGSFLFLNPILSVITNIDNDHLDYYKTEEKLKESFVEFSNKVPFYGMVAINGNDKNSVELVKNIRRPYLMYGIEGKERYSESIDFYGKDIVHSEKKTDFILCYKKKEFNVEISLSGDHNVQNALAAIVIAHQVGMPLIDICHALKDFQGVGRRFECLYAEKNFIVVDDYAHHPTELLATIETARVKYPLKKIIAVFEPHRFSRTKQFWSEFVGCFKGVDAVYIAPIYAASEKEVPGVTSEALVKAINKKYQNAYLLESWGQLFSIFKKYQDRDGVLLSMGAGSISKETKLKISQWKS